MPHEAIERANLELARLRCDIEMFKESMKRAEDALQRAENLVGDIVLRVTLNTQAIDAGFYNPRPEADPTGSKPPSAARADLTTAHDFV